MVGIYRHISEPVQRTQQRFRRADQHRNCVRAATITAHRMALAQRSDTL